MAVAPEATTKTANSQINTSDDHINDNSDGANGHNGNLDSAYSVFSKNQKRYIVFTASWAGLFSPLSSLTYLPALMMLSRDLNVSVTLINLTLTSYMVRSILMEPSLSLP
jgi:hypothetical protein